MFIVETNRIKELGRTPGGVHFTGLIDAIIYAQARISNIPISNVQTNLRTNLPDGGVDTSVDGFSSNDKSGYLNNCPTIWQYKAKDFK